MCWTSVSLPLSISCEKIHWTIIAFVLNLPTTGAAEQITSLLSFAIIYSTYMFAQSHFIYWMFHHLKIKLWDWNYWKLPSNGFLMLNSLSSIFLEIHHFGSSRRKCPQHLATLMYCAKKHHLTTVYFFRVSFSVSVNYRWHSFCFIVVVAARFRQKYQRRDFIVLECGVLNDMQLDKQFQRWNKIRISGMKCNDLFFFYFLP